MNKYLFVVLLAPGFAFAQQTADMKTVAACAQDLKVKVWFSGDVKKAEKYCTDYSQRTINCAIDLAQAKSLTYTFDSAVKDCQRTRDK